MSRPFAPVLLYGAALGTLCVVAVLFFEVLDPETPALLGGAALVMIAIAAAIALGQRGSPEAGDRDARVVPDSSFAVVWAALSLALMALGAELGLWLVYIGGGMLIVGIGGLVREVRASRELADRALGPGGRRERTAPDEGRGPRFELPGED